MKIPKNYTQDSKLKGYVKNLGAFCENHDSSIDDIRNACIDINQIDQEWGKLLKREWNKFIDSCYVVKHQGILDHYYDSRIFQKICEIISDYQKN